MINARDVMLLSLLLFLIKHECNQLVHALSRSEFIVMLQPVG
jgi:hypothetical protein